MLKKGNIAWSVKQIAKSIEKGTIVFDNAVQRSLVWDNNRKSLLIHSVLEDYPVPPFYSAKIDGIYSMLDGKQRLNALVDFVNGKFELSNLPEIAFDDEEEPEININGLDFAGLPEDFQIKILGFYPTLYYYEDITDDEINEMFFRLNNGKPLTAIELTRVKAKSMEKIKELSKHELFTSTLTEKAINKYTNEDITIKSWAILYTEEPNLETKSIRPLIEQAEITDEQADNLKAVYSKLLEVYSTLTATEDKQDNKIAKRIITRTHLVSLIPIISKQINNSTWDTNQFTEWVRHFFNGTKSATIDNNYNESARSGSGKTEAIKTRLEAITADFNRFVLKVA